MQTNITVNVKDPHADEDIIVPDTGGSDASNTPNTGYLTVDGSNNPNDSSALSSNILVLGIMSVVIIVAITALTLIARKHHIKFIFNRSKSVSRSLIALAILVSTLSFIGLKNLNHTYDSANAEEGTELAAQGDTLSINTTDAKLDVTLEDEPVYAYMKNTVTVSSPTEAGYTLTASIAGDTRDLVNTTNNTNSNNTGSNSNSDSNASSNSTEAKISGLATLSSQSLTDNTWGIALQEPVTKDSTVFHGLPVAGEEPLTLNVKGAGTEANDTTDVYVGTYVVPGLPYGTYSGVTINYTAVANVVTDDITVKYHGNGLYFDEAETQDENTVVYGNSCGMMYVGGNCQKAYMGVTPQTSEIVYGEYEVGNREDTVQIPGADILRVDISFNTMGNEFNVTGRETIDGYSESEYHLEETGEESFYIYGDIVKFSFIVSNSRSINTTSMNYSAEVYPVYLEQPAGIETTETSVCNIFKSNNIDNEGNQLTPYSNDGAVNTGRVITIPGADKLKVEITYGLTAGTGWIEFGKGNPQIQQSEYDGVYPEEENIAGNKTSIIDGNQVYFAYDLFNNTDEPLPEGYDYGFYVKIYPIYSEEKENTTPETVCSVINKSGTYINIFNNDYSNWYSQIDDPYDPDRTIEFSNENWVKSFIKLFYNEYAGKTIDLFATWNYIIHYDANDGEGEMGDQIIGGPYECLWEPGSPCGPSIMYNSFSNTDEYGDNYSFLEWNTKPDGSGTSYQEGESVNLKAKPGETITLYAQWGDSDTTQQEPEGS